MILGFRTKQIIWFFLILALLTSCETLKKRIEKNLSYFVSLPAEIQQKIRAGGIDLGFDQKMVYLSWGKKGDSASLTDEHGSFETWIFTSSSSQTNYRVVQYYDDEDKKWRSRQESYLTWYNYASKFVVFKDNQVVRFGTYPKNTLYSGPQGQYNPYQHPYSSYQSCPQMGFSQALLCSFVGGHW